MSGEPPPKVEWFFKDETTPLSSNDLITINNKDGSTNFVVNRSKRAQNGKYTIVAKNSAGEDRAEVDITVLGRPGIPKGPLKIDEIHKTGCHLKWEKPEDDGGCPVEGYEIEKLDPLTGQWLPCGKSTVPEFTVTGLQEGKPYKFRVKAVNKEGESDPLVNEGVIIAKNDYDEPGKPGAPVPTDWDKNFVELEWKRPESDGGAPIEKYVMQMRDKAGRTWVDAGTVPGDRTKGRIEPLEPGHEYEFRIVAVNKAGPGEPSDASKSIIAKPRFLKPRIDRKNLQKKVIRIGQFLRVEIDVEGEPCPVVTWTKDKKAISNDLIKITNEDYKTAILIQKATRADKGIYLITAKNSTGTDEAELEIEVLSKPAKCEGPLEVSDMTSDSCKLKWKKPEDDGGDPIDHYVVEKMDLETGRWVPVATSKTPEADITGLVEGKEYKFRVKAVNNEGDGEPLEAEGSYVAKNPYEVSDAPGKPQLEDWTKNSATLRWEPPASDGGSPITGYLIEKKDLATGKWVKALETKGDKPTAKVPDLVEGQTYQFRVKAINKAGVGKPSHPSDSMVAKNRFEKPRIDRTHMKDTTLKAGHNLRLDINVTGEPPPKKNWKINGKDIDDHEGINIVYEDYRTKLYIPVTKREMNGKLTLTAQNASGQDEATINLNILDKPSPPEGPMKVDDIHSEGCTLSWKPPVDDGGEPIECYQVQKLDMASGRWLPVGKTNDTKMKVNNLEPEHEYKFRVVAVNPEGESDPLESEHSIVAKNPFDEPDKPGKPEIVDWDKDRVDIQWTPPLNDGGSPVTKYIIEKQADNGKWQKAGEVPADTTKASIQDLDENTPYTFRVRAVNEAGPGKPSDVSQTVVTKPRKCEI